MLTDLLLGSGREHWAHYSLVLGGLGIVFLGHGT